jgi:hypothetical protein
VGNANYGLNFRAFDIGIALGTKVDFNGDGKTDFIRQEKGAWDDDPDGTSQVYLSKGDGSFNRVELPDAIYHLKGDFTNLIVGDYNGDGKTDFIRQEKGTWDDDDKNTANIYLSNGDGTFRSQLLTNYANMKGDFTNLIVGDYNGDGKSDFIRQEKGAWDDDDKSTAEIYLSNGNGTFRSQLLTNYANMKGDFTNLIVGDYNGDGKSDFIRQEKGAWDDDDKSTAEIYLSNGNGTFRSQLLVNQVNMKGDFTNLIVGDYNGDGKSDFIRQEKGEWAKDDISTAEIYLANGDGTFRSQLLTNYANMKGDFTNLYVGDFNGDGKSDFIRQEKGAWDDDDQNTAEIYLSNGNSTFRSQLLSDWVNMKGDFTNLYVGNISQFLTEEQKSSVYYYPELTSLTEAKWDYFSGDNTRIWGIVWDGEVDERADTPDQIKAIYRDLSRSVTGGEYRMTAGYIDDSSYLRLEEGLHTGIDIEAPKFAPVYALDDGVVTAIENLGSRGYFIHIKGKSGTWVYGHIDNSRGLTVGQQLKAGQQISQVGDITAFGDHLHLEFRIEDRSTYKQSPDVLRKITNSPIYEFWKLKNQ